MYLAAKNRLMWYFACLFNILPVQGDADCSWANDIPAPRTELNTCNFPWNITTCISSPEEKHAFGSIPEDKRFQARANRSYFEKIMLESS